MWALYINDNVSSVVKGKSSGHIQLTIKRFSLFGIHTIEGWHQIYLKYRIDQSNTSSIPDAIQTV